MYQMNNSEEDVRTLWLNMGIREIADFFVEKIY